MEWCFISVTDGLTSCSEAYICTSTADNHDGAKNAKGLSVFWTVLLRATI